MCGVSTPTAFPREVSPNMAPPSAPLIRPTTSNTRTMTIIPIAKGNEQVYGDALTVLSEIQMGRHTRRIREEAYNAIDFLNED